VLPLQAVAEVYAVRREIELLFRELKSQLRLDHMPSGNKAAAECMLFASILALALDRILRRDLAARDAIAVLVGAPAHRPFLERRLRRVLRVEAPDPNRQRLSLPDRARATIPTSPN
jgi:hypothetical protein